MQNLAYMKQVIYGRRDGTTNVEGIEDIEDTLGVKVHEAGRLETSRESFYLALKRANSVSLY